VPFFLGAIGPEETALATATSRAWLAFARSGEPGHDGLPDWPAYDADRRATMVLGTAPAVEDDPASAVREVWADRI
jgi:para-nitrobenzyl esterase